MLFIKTLYAGNPDNQSNSSCLLPRHLLIINFQRLKSEATLTNPYTSVFFKAFMPNVIKSVNSFSRNYDGKITAVRKTIAKLPLSNLTALYSVECVVKALFSEVDVAFSAVS